ncbi:MAG: bifunctional methionine sulfoxide reductase B/A protein [Candidatus Omnitrophota bacterium]
MLIFNAKTGIAEDVEPVVRPEAEWKKILTPEQYRVTRKKGTEAPFTGKCEKARSGGIYKCIACGTDLFRARAKFESGTGWPSFGEPVSEMNIVEQPDNSLGMSRIEVMCARCGAHMGHVFSDGPFPAKRRYCINSVAVKFVPEDSDKNKREPAIFAAGCFWGVEETFRTIKGVVSTIAGYAGGKTAGPTYEEVCTGGTGHAEAVKIEYDPLLISYDDLLDVFWRMHDPTTPDRQGPDRGTQYRSAIFCANEEQKDAAIASKEKLARSGLYKHPIVTGITLSSEFYPAEEYHQKYYMKRGIEGCSR